MFTGIVPEGGGTVVRVETNGRAGRLVIGATPWEPPLGIGESVSVHGVCLTVVRIEGDPSALRRARGDLPPDQPRSAEGPGSKLNPRARAALWRPQAVGTSSTATVTACGHWWRHPARGQGLDLTIACVAIPSRRRRVSKGSVSLDGISLTVRGADVKTASPCNIIPHTWEVTALCELRPGDRVNIETDVIAKYVRRLVERGQAFPELSWDESSPPGPVPGVATRSARR